MPGAGPRGLRTANLHGVLRGGGGRKWVQVGMGALEVSGREAAGPGLRSEETRRLRPEAEKGPALPTGAESFWKRETQSARKGQKGRGSLEKRGGGGGRLTRSQQQEDTIEAFLTSFPVLKSSPPSGCGGQCGDRAPGSQPRVGLVPPVARRRPDALSLRARTREGGELSCMLLLREKRGAGSSAWRRRSACPLSASGGSSHENTGGGRWWRPG